MGWPCYDHYRQYMGQLIARDGCSCAYCGLQLRPTWDREPPAATIDHFIPKFLGRSDDLENMVIACQPCNNRKGDMHPAKWMRLIWGDDLSGCPHKLNLGQSA